jgi:hypothetical protein
MARNAGAGAGGAGARQPHAEGDGKGRGVVGRALRPDEIEALLEFSKTL